MSLTDLVKVNMTLFAPFLLSGTEAEKALSTKKWKLLVKALYTMFEASMFSVIWFYLHPYQPAVKTTED